MKYLLREIPDDLWRSFKSRCATQGKTMLRVIIELITEYANGRKASKSGGDIMKELEYKISKLLQEQQPITESEAQDLAHFICELPELKAIQVQAKVKVQLMKLMKKWDDKRIDLLHWRRNWVMPGGLEQSKLIENIIEDLKNLSK